MKQSRMVVVTEFLLGRQGGKFTMSGKKQLREGAVVTREYVENINADEKNCKHFEIDEEATERYYEVAKEQLKERQLNAQKGKLDVSALAKALVGEKQSTPAKEEVKEVKETPKFPEGKPNDDWSKSELQAYMTANDIDFDARNGRAKLLDSIKTKQA